MTWCVQTTQLNIFTNFVSVFYLLLSPICLCMSVTFSTYEVLFHLTFIFNLFFQFIDSPGRDYLWEGDLLEEFV